MVEGSLIFVAEVARSLGPLLDRVVFIGGSIAPLLQVDRQFDAPRPTKDVDAIAMAVGYPDFENMCEELRGLLFRQTPDGPHVHRWIAPGPHSVAFDLVPTGYHFGASGNPWDEVAMQTACSTALEPGLVIRHASGPGFLALKFAAFRDRGVDDPHRSADLEDIFGLIASRPQILDEIVEAPDAIRTFVSDQASTLLNLDVFEDLVAGHLNNVPHDRAAEVIRATTDRLELIARPGSGAPAHGH